MRRALAFVAALVCGSAAAADFGRQPLADSREPPAYAPLSGDEGARYELGLRVFNTQWVVAGTPRAMRIDGLGPLFNVGSCDGCHNDGARGRGPEGDGPVPGSLVLQLQRDAGPDPVYGHTLNVAAIDGLDAEAALSVHYRARRGRYPDGALWTLRVPAYRVEALRDGALAADTILRPRIAPALYGVGLLERISDAQRRRWAADPAARRDGIRGERAGRFGWQGASVSLAEQTARAFSREMGLTTRLLPADDCTPAQTRCRLADGGVPEVDDALFAAVLAFQQKLAVPAVPRRPDQEERAGAALFAAAGCALCHRPRASVRLGDGRSVTIAAYSDLLLHDLGPGLTDRDVAGRVVTSRWRTAPLWAVGLVPRTGVPTYLHDGRALSLEQAVLWHDGEAARARQRFEALGGARREQLLAWLARR